MKEIITALRDVQIRMRGEREKALETGSPFLIGEIVEVTRGNYWTHAIVISIDGHYHDDDQESWRFGALEFNKAGDAIGIRRPEYWVRAPLDGGVDNSIRKLPALAQQQAA